MMFCTLFIETFQLCLIYNNALTVNVITVDSQYHRVYIIHGLMWSHMVCRLISSSVGTQSFIADSSYLLTMSTVTDGSEYHDTNRVIGINWELYTINEPY